jgi:hypothetical protein
MHIRTVLAASLLLAGCGDTGANAAPVQPAASAQPAAAGRPQPGRWAGVATEGYKGDSIQFTVVADGTVRDVVLSGHWRCGPTPSSRTIERIDVGHVPGTFSVGADGAFGGEKREPYLLWTVNGRFTGPAQASGTLRVEYHTECDTQRPSWTAAPVGA